MQTESVNLKINSEVKEQAQELFSNLGMSLETAVNVFLMQSIRENAIPFKISGDPFYSAENQKYLREVIAGIESGKSELKEHELAEVGE